MASFIFRGLLNEDLSFFHGSRTADQYNNVSLVEFSIGTRGEDHMLSSANSHDGSTGDLPEIQTPDAASNQAGPFWDANLVVGKGGVDAAEKVPKLLSSAA